MKRQLLVIAFLCVSAAAFAAQVKSPDAEDAFGSTAETVTAAATSEPAPQSVKAACQTEATPANGERNACDSGWTVLVAPSGWVISQTKVDRATSFGGSYNWCEEVFSDHVDLVPGVPMPTRFALRAHNYSGAGAFGGGGHTNCDYTLYFAKRP